MSCDNCSFPYSLCQCPGVEIPIGPVGSVVFKYCDHITNKVHRFWHLKKDEPPYTHWKPSTQEVFRIELDSPYKLRRVDRGQPYFEGLGYLNPISREFRMININASRSERELFRQGTVLRVWKISAEQERIYFEECPLPAAAPEPTALIKVLERIADALEQANYRNLQRDVNGR